MTRATKQRDKAHARVYAAWRDLPAWQRLDAQAKTLLLEMMLCYRPQEPVIDMSDRQAARLIPCSRGKAAEALRALENFGWIRVERVGALCAQGQKRRASAYRLTMLPFHAMPPTSEFQTLRIPANSSSLYY